MNFLTASNRATHCVNPQTRAEIPTVKQDGTELGLPVSPLIGYAITPQPYSERPNINQSHIGQVKALWFFFFGNHIRKCRSTKKIGRQEVFVRFFFFPRVLEKKKPHGKFVFFSINQCLLFSNRRVQYKRRADHNIYQEKFNRRCLNYPVFFLPVTFFTVAMSF